MPSVKEYVDYFEGIATQHKEIQHTDAKKHFARINIEEVLTGLRSSIFTPALILESFEGGLIDNKSDNILADRMGAFMILKEVEHDNFKQEAEFLDDCERIGLDAIRRMRRDARVQPIQARLLRGLQLSKVGWMKVGPVFDNWYGYRFTFSLEDHENMKYDDSKWLDGNG